MKKKKKLISLAVFICYILNIQAQTGKKVTGKVVDVTGELAGVSVVIKGTAHGTTTDFNGIFQLSNVRPERVSCNSLLSVIRHRK